EVIKYVKLLYSSTILYYNIRLYNFLLDNSLRLKIINFSKLSVNSSYTKISPRTRYVAPLPDRSL
ncbi:hypothetical protein CTAM01_16216, partial [Colletotrichum tamarilloi]